MKKTLLTLTFVACSLISSYTPKTPIDYNPTTQENPENQELRIESGIPRYFQNKTFNLPSESITPDQKEYLEKDFERMYKDIFAPIENKIDPIRKIPTNPSNAYTESKARLV